MIKDDIKNIRIQGATAIASETLKYLLKFSSRHRFDKVFFSEARKIQGLRPTAVVLHNAIQRIEHAPAKSTIEGLIEEIETAKRKIAVSGSRLIRNGSVVLTHCHSSEAIWIIREAAKKRKFTVIAGETRPKGQGYLTAAELAKIKKLKAFFTDDSAMGYYMGKKSIVLVGSDAFRKEGLVNKIGTYMMAASAKEKKIKFYSAGNMLKLDSRRKIEIEMRPTSEISGKMKNVSIVNPAFDITPWNLVTSVITDKGIKSPAKIRGMIR